MEKMNTKPQIRITNLSWGKIEVKIADDIHTFRDCKIWPGGVKEWDWNITGTRHSPGIQVEDIRELLQRDIDVIILAVGQQNRLQVKPETKTYLENEGIPYFIENTTRAVVHFNKLSREDRNVAGVFHTTC